MRAFVALPVAEEVRGELAAAVTAWREHVAGPGDADAWRWTRPEGWHVTLAFLGAIDDEQATRAARVAGVAAAGTGPITLRLGDLGRFGRGVLHVAVEDLPAGRVADLGGRVQTALADAGLPVQLRDVRAHLTLARARRGQRPTMPSMAPPGAAWEVDEARLYASHPGPGGASYEVVSRLPLR